VTLVAAIYATHAIAAAIVSNTVADMQLPAPTIRERRRASARSRRIDSSTVPPGGLSSSNSVNNHVTIKPVEPSAENIPNDVAIATGANVPPISVTVGCARTPIAAFHLLQIPHHVTNHLHPMQQRRTRRASRVTRRIAVAVTRV